MLRCGTAIEAFLKEAEHAQSKADFLNKMNLALKRSQRNRILVNADERYRIPE